MKKIFTEEDLKNAYNLGKQQGALESNNLNNSSRTDEFSSQLPMDNSIVKSVETDSLIRLR
ncbi:MULTISPECIES: hypothetical protein [Clostridium]|uniref:Uncharacterized protein n=1 Tax=Clostridium senegalense TaxID=1465809 RepID=A0A6M0H6S0_9CLOT|nr:MULTISPECIES: hypothetical protein [Clostridium]NEU05693.1 hypothetical protein [Clostridium senegalense]